MKVGRQRKTYQAAASQSVKRADVIKIKALQKMMLQKKTLPQQWCGLLALMTEEDRGLLLLCLSAQ